MVSLARSLLEQETFLSKQMSLPTAGSLNCKAETTKGLGLAFVWGEAERPGDPRCGKTEQEEVLYDAQVVPGGLLDARSF